MIPTTPAGTTPAAPPTTGPADTTAPQQSQLPSIFQADLGPSDPDDIAKTYDLAAKVFGQPNTRQDDELFHEATRKSLGWSDTLDDMGSGFWNGLEDFGQATATPLANWMSGENRDTKTKNTEATTLGSLTNTVAQQLPALIPITKAATLGRAAWAGSKAFGSKFAASGLAKFFTSASIEFTTAAVAYGGKEEKLSDTLAPMFKDTTLGPVFDYIKTDPTGSEAMNRARNGIENLGLGLATSALFKGGLILARRVFAKEAGAAAEEVAKNTAADIAQFRREFPEVAAKIDEAMKTGADMTEEQAFSAVMAVSSKFAAEGGTKAEELAKLLTFVNGDNESKATAVDAVLSAQEVGVKLEADMTAKVDKEFEDYYAAHGRRLRAKRALENPTHVGPEGPPLITPNQDKDARLFEAFKKSEGTVLPSSGETIVTPAPRQPIGLLPAPVEELETVKFLKANKPKVEPASVEEDDFGLGGLTWGDMEDGVKPGTALEPPPPAKGFTRFYHGGAEYKGGGRDLTPSYDYAEGYRHMKHGDKGQVYYVDVPDDHPLLSKMYDDEGTDTVSPFNNFHAPEELAKDLKPFKAPVVEPKTGSDLTKELIEKAKAGWAQSGATRPEAKIDAPAPFLSPGEVVGEAVPNPETFIGRLYDRLSPTAKSEIAAADADGLEAAVIQKARAEGIRFHEDDLDAIDIALESRLRSEARAAGKPKAEIDAIKVGARHPNSIWHSVSDDAAQLIDETEPEEWAGNWPALGNTRRATQGLSDSDKHAFHTVRTFVAQFTDPKGKPAYPTEKQIIAGMKAHAATLDKASAPELKARLAKLTPADVDDFLDRIDRYYGGNDPVPVTPADLTGVKPKSELVEIDGEDHVVQTYVVHADGRELRVHAEHLPGGKYGLSVSVPDNRVVKAKNGEEVRTGWRTIDLQKKVDHASLQTAVADAATQSQKYYKLDSAGKPEGWAQVVDGRGVIGLFKTANVGTLVHELTHTFDLLDVAPEFMARLRQSLGFAADDRSKEAAEAVARAFEHYAYKGELDAAWKKPGFTKLSEFLSAVYTDVEKTAFGLEISEPVRMAFRGFGGLKAIGDHVGVRPELQELKARLLDTDFDDHEARQAIFDKATETYLNLGTIEGSDAQTVMAQLTDAFDHVIQADRGGVETHKLAVKYATDMMLHNGGSLSTLSEIARGAEHLREINGKFLFWRGMNQSWADQTAKTLKALRASPNDEGLQKQFEIAFDSFSRMRMMMQDLQTESARLLGKHGVKMPSLPIDEGLAGMGYKKLMEADAKTGGKLLRDFEAAIKAAGNDPTKKAAVITTFSDSVRYGGYQSLAKSLYLSSILSHPRVMFGVQAVSGLASTITQPARYIAGGVWNRDPEAVRFGVNLYYNLFHTTLDMAHLSLSGSDEGSEAWASIFQTLRQGSSVSDHSAIPYLRPSQVRDLSAPWGKIADAVYAVPTMPLRVMTTIDEFWRQLYGRAFLRSRGMDEAYKQGFKFGSAEFEDTVANFVKSGFDGNRAILDPETILELDALTFKKPLRDSGSTAVQLLNHVYQKASPVSWVFQPFLRTPVNIGREAAMSIPGIQYLSSSFREGLKSSNPRIAAAYRGRQIMGLMTLGLFVGLSANGNITGAGPKRGSAEWDAWTSAGYQPYSFVWHNSDGTVSCLSYQQLEPFSTVAGLCANVAEEKARNGGDEETWSAVAGAIAPGLAKTYSDKRYLTGLSTMLKVLTADPAAAKQSLSQVAAGVIPLSGAQAAAADILTDDEFKHAQGVLQRIQSRTLFKVSLEPDRDFFGKPQTDGGWMSMSPLPYRHGPADPVVTELNALKGRVTNGFSEKLRGLDLTTFKNAKGQSANDRRMELRQEVKQGGYTLHDALGRVIASSAYKALEGDLPELQKARADKLQSVVEQYNAAIQTQLLSEFPDLKRAYFAADPMVKRQQSRKTVAALTAIPK